MPRATSPKAPAKKQATPPAPSKPLGRAKVAPKGTTPAKVSPAVRTLPEAEWPKSHPMYGKKVTALIKIFGKPEKKVVGKVEAGDKTVIRIGGLWYFASSVTFA